MNIDVNRLFVELGSLSQVEAIALGGSRATGRNDESQARKQAAATEIHHGEERKRYTRTYTCQTYFLV